MHFFGLCADAHTSVVVWGVGLLDLSLLDLGPIPHSTVDVCVSVRRPKNERTYNITHNKNVTVANNNKLTIAKLSKRHVSAHNW